MTYPFKLPEGVQVIGITGKANTGKDTVADYLNTFPGVYIFPFAEPLKDAMNEAFGLPREQSRVFKETKISHWGVSPREIYQFAGTEIFREGIAKLLPDIGNNFWIKRHWLAASGFLEGCVAYDPGDTVVIPDVRFQNEVEYIYENDGILISLDRPGSTAVGISSHASEAGVFIPTKVKHFHILNDSTLEDLYATVDHVIDKFSLQFSLNF